MNTSAVISECSVGLVVNYSSSSLAFHYQINSPRKKKLKNLYSKTLEQKTSLIKEDLYKSSSCKETKLYEFLFGKKKNK